MSRLSIKQFHRFLTDDVTKEVRDRYWRYEILSEADLQVIVWQLIHSFIGKFDGEFERFKILNKPYLKGLRIHPDIVVFENKKPWVVIELKESKKINTKAAKIDWKRLIKNKQAFSARRSYLFYIARYGVNKVFSGPKKKGKKYFFEIPIVLETIYPKRRIKKWEEEYKVWSKYSGK